MTNVSLLVLAITSPLESGSHLALIKHVRNFSLKTAYFSKFLLAIILALNSLHSEVLFL